MCGQLGLFVSSFCKDTNESMMLSLQVVRLIHSSYFWCASQWILVGGAVPSSHLSEALYLSSVTWRGLDHILPYSPKWNEPSRTMIDNGALLNQKQAFFLIIESNCSWSWTLSVIWTKNQGFFPPKHTVFVFTFSAMTLLSPMSMLTTSVAFQDFSSSPCTCSEAECRSAVWYNSNYISYL